MRLSKTITRKYYLKKLWKITTKICYRGKQRFAFAKHYEKRAFIGADWEHVRTTVLEGYNAAKI